MIGTEDEEEDDFFWDVLNDASGVAYVFASQNWKRSHSLDMQEVMFHELHHLVHMQGWASVWPEIFGDVASSVDDGDDDADDDWPAAWDESLVCKEVARLQCTNPGWVHIENTCPCDDDYRAPGDPAPSPLHGTCNTNDCDCVEFHRAAGLTYAGQYDSDTCYSYDSIAKGNMPQTKATISEMLSDEYKAILDDPKYAQPRKPLTGAYKPS